MFVIDTQVVKGYFLEHFLAKAHSLTASAIPLFGSLGPGREVYLDDRGQVKAEWRSKVDRELFEVWFTDLVRDGKAILIPVGTEPALRRRLVALGFPDRSENLWFMRTAVATTKALGQVSLITEDLDYFEPREKGCSANRRRDILSGNLGRVRREFRDIDVSVLAVCNAMA